MPANAPLLEIESLRTYFTVADGRGGRAAATRDDGGRGTVRAVDGVSLTVPRRRTVCVVGESGCGKSVTARSILGLVEPPGRIVGGAIRWHHADPVDGGDPPEPVDLATLDPRGERMRRIRGGEISMVFQEPMASLSPLYTVGQQLTEAVRLHLPVSKTEARDHAIAMLHRVGIPRPERRMEAYPFQLSGGMCQRVMVAIALACGPSLLIADEPTTALDVTTQARILDLVGQLQDETGMSVLFITHDLGVVAEIADEVVVMYLGTVVERGSVTEIFHDPKHPYTRALLASVPAMGGGARRRLASIRGTVPPPGRRPAGCPFHPRCDHAVPGLCDRDDPPTIPLGAGREVRCVHYTDGGSTIPAGPAVARDRAAPDDRPAGGDSPLLQVRGLAMRYPVKKGMLGRVVGQVRAVDGVDLTIHAGQTLGLVGESGCGKTTLGRCIVRAVDPAAGQILYRDADGRQVDLARLSGRDLRPYQRQVRIIFQDPFSSLNPRMTLLQLVGDPLRAHRVAAGSELEDRVADMLRRVGLAPEYLRRYPHAFSGGERQRVNIARALILQPRLVVADEPVSALDVSVRAQILNLLRDLQEQLDLTYLFISHDLSVVESVCDRVAVMYLGRLVETAGTADLYGRPQHPYTEALLSAVPRPDPAQRGTGHRIRLDDELPDPADPPSGCAFHPRCPHAQPQVCTAADRVPALRGVAGGQHAACHRAEELRLVGVNGDLARRPAGT